MKLLIATDFSATSRLTIEEAVSRPWPAGTTADIVHVVELAVVPHGGDILNINKKIAESAIESPLEELRRVFPQASAQVLFGDTRRVLADYAEKTGADLILAGSHGGSGVTRFLLGSVAQGIVRTAPCSVEIVRKSKSAAAPRGAMKILVSTDGSEIAKAAVKSVAARPWPAGSVFQVLSAIPLVVPVTDVSVPYFYAEQITRVMESLEKQARANAAAAESDARKVLESVGLKCEEAASVPLGDPKAVILDQANAWGADLIVVGSHGWRGINHLILGSVSEAVAMHARCSVEVVRERRAG